MPQPTARPAPKTTREQQALEAYRLYCQRVPYDEIAKQLGVSSGTAHNRVQQGMKMLHLPDAKQARDEDLELIDSLIEAQIPAAKNGNATAAKTILGLLTRRAAMMGYDSPTKLEHSGSVETVTPADKALQDMAQLFSDISSANNLPLPADKG